VAKALLPKFLDVIRVDQRKNWTAGNLVTACVLCARVTVGRLLKDAEDEILAENLKLCVECGIDPAEVLEPKMGGPSQE